MYKKMIISALLCVVCVLFICGETSYAQAITDGSYPETKYECNYVYSQMSKAERNVYDQMYKLCYKWMLSQEDVKQMKYGEYCIGPVDYSSVSDTEVGRLFSEIECRQKFFFIEDCMYTIDGSHEDVYFIVRSEYVDGKKRYDKFNEFKNRLYNPRIIPNKNRRLFKEINDQSIILVTLGAQNFPLAQCIKQQNNRIPFPIAGIIIVLMSIWPPTLIKYCIVLYMEHIITNQ